MSPEPDSGALIPPGGGERPFDLFYRIVVDREEICAQQSDHTPGVLEPPPHVHHHHSDCFFVIEGHLDVRCGDTQTRLEQGGLIFAPPDLVHGYSDGPARFLNIHAPGMRFADRLRGKEIEFDQHEPPDDGGRPASDGILLADGEGDWIELGGARACVKVPGGAGIGSLGVILFELPAGSPGPPPHIHEGMTDSFYVLSGTPQIRLGDELLDAPPDSYAYTPPGVVHTISNPGAEPARFLGITAPGGLDAYLRELAADPADFPAIAAAHDVVPVN